MVQPLYSYFPVLENMKNYKQNPKILAFKYDSLKKMDENVTSINIRVC